MEIIDKLVEFHKYCKTCKHRALEEWLDPCHDCLNHPINQNSKKPVNYDEDEKKVKETRNEENN